MADSSTPPSNGGRSPQPVDMTRFRDFGDVVRFFRIEGESQRPGASRPKGTDVTDAGQAATAGRIYRAVLDCAAHRYGEAPRENEPLADIRLVFDSRLAERLAGWSIRWARAQIRETRPANHNSMRSGRTSSG